MNKFWLVLSIAMVYASSAMGASIHYNAERPGEGITVTESLENGLAWILFTHMNLHEPEDEVGNPIPPVVSPAPPPDPEDPPEVCSIPPIVSPAPPDYDPCPVEDEIPPICESDPYLQLPVWFTGNTTEWDGQTGIGIVYYTQSSGYPYETGETFPVGTFVITKIEGGYELTMQSDGVIQDMSAFHITYSFETELSK